MMFLNACQSLFPSWIVSWNRVASAYDFRHCVIAVLIVASLGLLAPQSVVGQQAGKLSEGLTFYASFDSSTDADVALGDKKVYHSKSLDRKTSLPGLPADVVTLDSSGKWGKSLRFGKRSEIFTFYKGEGNVGVSESNLSGTISLWMKLDPQKDLEPGYVDPLQITDKAWNDSCLFLDFTKDDVPRKFRLGVFSDYRFWNPKDISWDDIAEKDRPMVVVDKPTFSADRWTHIAITWNRFNTEQTDTTAELFVDGKSMGKLSGKQKFSWNPERLAILLGIYYTGNIDEVALWNRTLSKTEVEAIHSSTARLQP
jgi:hypothetical protein